MVVWLIRRNQTRLAQEVGSFNPMLIFEQKAHSRIVLKFVIAGTNSTTILLGNTRPGHSQQSPKSRSTGPMPVSKNKGALKQSCPISSEDDRAGL